MGFMATPPYNFEDKQMAIEAGRKGGRTVTDKRRIAWRLMGLKKKAKMTDKDLQWFEHTLLDPHADIVNMKATLEEAHRNGSIETDKYITLTTTIHKLAHGEKHQHKHELFDVNRAVEFAYKQRMHEQK